MVRWPTSPNWQKKRPDSNLLGGLLTVPSQELGCRARAEASVGALVKPSICVYTACPRILFGGGSSITRARRAVLFAGLSPVKLDHTWACLSAATVGMTAVSTWPLQACPDGRAWPPKQRRTCGRLGANS